MASFSRESHTKFNFVTLLFVIFILIIIGLNVGLNLSKTKIPQISFSSIIYLPPNILVINKVFLSEPDSGKQIIFAPVILAKFSFSELLLRRRLLISDIYVYKPQFDYNEFASILKKDFSKIIALFSHLPKQNIKISIKDATSDLVKNTNPADYIALSSCLTLKDDNAYCSGFLSSGTQKLPLKWNFRGYLKNNKFWLENLELTRENFYCKLWADFNESDFHFKGFTFIDTSFKERSPPEIHKDVSKTIKFFLSGAIDNIEIAELPRAGLYILDINCQGKFSYPEILIERLDCSLNNNPISLSGRLTLLGPIFVDVQLYFNPLRLKGELLQDCKEAVLRIKGELEHNAFKGNASLGLDFINKKDDILSFASAELDCQGVNFYYDSYPLINMSIDKSNIVYRTENSSYEVFLENMDSKLDLGDAKKGSQLVKFSSDLYDGVLEGDLAVSTSQSLIGINSNLRLKNISAEKLKQILEHFSKVHGNLSAEVQFSNYPSLVLGGSLILKDGYISDFAFFKWLSDLFDLPLLRKIDYNNASTDFSVNADSASLNKIKLDSPDLHLSGYFNLHSNNLVNSALSLDFSKQLLGKSSKFKPLLKLLSRNNDLSSLRFDFQLSGRLQGMNFKWQESDFKEELQELIPDYVERRIERNIDKIINSISAE